MYECVYMIFFTAKKLKITIIYSLAGDRYLHQVVFRFTKEHDEIIANSTIIVLPRLRRRTECYRSNNDMQKSGYLFATIFLNPRV